MLNKNKHKHKIYKNITWELINVNDILNRSAIRDDIHNIFG